MTATKTPKGAQPNPERPAERRNGAVTMTDLRALLGDRYVSTMRAAVLADNPAAITNAQQVGGKLGQLMYLSAVDRLDRTLAAVLPDLLGNNAKALNDVLPREVLRQKAAAFDEGRRLGLRQADYEMGAALNMPDLTNPYRQGSEGTEAIL